MNKPVIILAKGPSARFIKKSDKYEVATINNAIWMHKTPKWAFFNDFEPIEQMSDDDFKGVTTMITPSYIHSLSIHMDKRRTGEDFARLHYLRLHEFYPGRFDHVNFKNYELFSNDNKRLGENFSRLDMWPNSTTQTALMWLCKFENVRNIIVAGADVVGGFHPYFSERALKREDGSPAFGGASTAPQGVKFYQNAWNQSLQIVKRYGAKFRHINDLTPDQLDELGLTGETDG